MAWRAARAAAACAMMLAASCGGGSPAAPAPPAANPFRITISAAGVVTPVELVVPPGTRVLFINEHSRPHDMTSDDHPDHLDCPAINSVGLLNSGQSRETGNLVAIRTCGFHDHINPADSRLAGRIVIR
jgi:plastocyanin